MRILYRPQRSCGQGNVFTGVCLSTGGQGVSLSACWDAIPPGTRQTPPGTRQTPPGTRQTPPRTRQTPRDQADPPGPGRHPPWDQAVTTPEVDSSIRSTSGRYAFYWNAFLFKIVFSKILEITNIFIQIVMMYNYSTR